MSNPRVPFRSAENQPILPAPDGRPLIVQVSVAIEAWPYDRPVPRKLMPAPHGIEHVPDVPNYSWGEYGMRCGVPRLLEVLRDREVAANAFLNLQVIRAYPSVAESVLKAGWEFVAHGIEQEALNEENEAAVVNECVEGIRQFTGEAPRGWVGPGLRETLKTPDVLKAAGMDFVLDWAIDDLPDWMQTAHGPLMVLPYTLELNDSVIYAVEKHSTPEQYHRLQATLDVVGPEAARRPRVLTLTLHHHLSGVPHRVNYVAKMLDLLRERDDVVFMTASQIHDWYAAHAPAPHPVS